LTISRRRLDGVLLLDKPSGITSNAALMRVRRLFNAEKAGHTGTLDPLASGLLPVCFGEATKFARFLLDASKRYRAVVRLGVTTTTQDAEGDVVETRPVAVGRAEVEAALPTFMGKIRQIPPAYSALKHQGRSHYEYARAGIDVPRPPRDVHIAALALVDWSPPLATIDIECSKGTYVRTLAADLGEALGCGAHVAQLRRTAAGGFVIDDATSFHFLEQAAPEERDRLLLPVDALLGTLPRIDVDSIGAAQLGHGRALASEGKAEELLRAYAPTGALLGVVRACGGALVPVRMTSSPQFPGADSAGSARAASG
jgi:tRNA pseudouridine55 synthase